MNDDAAALSPPPMSSGWRTLVLGASADIRAFLALTIQLALLVFVIRNFQLETPLFYEEIMPLTFFAFLIHYFLPQRHRLSFFILVSLVGIYLALGFPNSLWLIGLGLLLIGACHLPVPFALRVGLIVTIGTGLALLRLRRIETSWSNAVLPILASMFMFRIILYLYDLKHQKSVSIQHALAYFFLLPNVAFPIFPIIDYSTFRRTYYDTDRHAIHQKGIRWILLGIVQLFAYRYIHHFWAIAPEDATSLPRLLQLAATDYLLIFRVIGQYNLVIGILYLFGFNLPPIVERFLLSGSFTEFWRRANSYWTDFMQKVFFYPVYFRLRKLNPTLNLVVSMVVVFGATWLLHAYQSLWIRGSYRLSLPDLLFWAIFGACVIVSAVYESKAGRRRTLGATTLSVRGAVSRALRAMLLFAAVAVMWSLWNSPTVSDWFYFWFDTEITFAEVISVIPMLLLAFAVFFAAILLFERTPQRGTDAAEPGVGVPFFRRTGFTAAATVFLVLLGMPLVSLQGNGEAPEALRALKGTRLNAVEVERLTRGYYEKVNAANQFSATNLLDLDQQKEGIVWPPLRDTEAGQESKTFIRNTIVPSVTIDFHGAPLSTNRWGMRDRDYEQQKPSKAYRIALLGGSPSFGSGVANDQTFEALLEDRLNAENRRDRYATYEILNFSIPKNCTIQHLALLESQVVSFEPDVVLLISSSREDTCSARHIADVVKNGIDIPYDFLREIVRKAKVDKDSPYEHAFRRLNRYGEEMLREAYPHFVRICREHGILPAYAYTPNVKATLRRRDAEKDARLMNFAEQAGFLVLDVANAFEGHDTASLQVAPWDWHPNVLGHRLLADRLYEAFRQSEQSMGLKLAQGRESD